VFDRCYLKYTTQTDQQEIDVQAEKMAGLFLKNNADLKDINLELKAGEHLAVLSEKKGRSTLLILAAAGELELIEGTFNRNGETVYQGNKLHFLEDTLIQNILMGMKYDEQKYLKVIRVVGLEQLLRGVNKTENKLLLQNASFLAEDTKKQVILARLLYIDAEIYTIDKFFDNFPTKFIDTALKNIFNTIWKDKTILVATDNIHVALICQRSCIMAHRTIESYLEPHELEESYRSLFRQTNYFRAKNMDMLDRPSDDSTKDNSLDYCSLLANFEKNWYTKQRDLLKGYNLENSIEELSKEYEAKAYYFLSKLTHVKSFKRLYVLSRFFIFNSGWILPTLSLLLILINFTSTYFFTWFVISWKNNIFGLTSKQYMEVFIGISAVTILSVILTNYIIIHFVRKVSVKLFVYTIKGLLVHSLEWFQKTPLERIISCVVTEFSFFEEQISSALTTNIELFIKLHIVIGVIMYDTHFTGVFIFIIYLLVMRSIYKVINGVRYLRDIICSNQTYLIHSYGEFYRGLPHFRNSGKVDYHSRCLKMICEIYQNSKGHQNQLAERWLFTRVHGLVLLIPPLIILNGAIRYWVGWKLDTFEILKITISFDLLFTIGPLVNSTITQSALLTVLERLRSMIMEDSIASKRNVMALCTLSGSLGGKYSIKVNDVVIANPLLKTMLLCGVSLEVFQGTRLALTGPRGSGKQTLLESIYRAIDYKRILNGTIYFRGQNIMSMPDWQLYSSMIMLSSHFTLVPGVLRDNIDPKKEHADEEIYWILDYLGYWKLLEYENSLIRNRINGKSILNIKSTMVNFHSQSINPQTYRKEIDNIRETHGIRVDTQIQAPKFSKNHEVFSLGRNKKFEEHVKDTKIITKKKRQKEIKKSLPKRGHFAFNEVKSRTSSDFRVKESPQYNMLDEAVAGEISFIQDPEQRPSTSTLNSSERSLRGSSSVFLYSTWTKVKRPYKNACAKYFTRG
jgi:ABC-type transport system involved in cytochrome bd biosynthesis fused ATPase/permease subunit